MVNFTMGVVIRNLQHVVPVRRARLRKDVETLRHILGIQKFDLGLVCVDNCKMQRINSIYRKKNAPTDVLSFPFYEVRSYFLSFYQQKSDMLGNPRQINWAALVNVIYLKDLRPGKIPCGLHRDEHNLGDIFLGVEYVMQQCNKTSQDLHSALTVSKIIRLLNIPVIRVTLLYQTPWFAFVQVVTAHGICHLLGYRHETDEEWKEVFILCTLLWCITIGSARYLHILSFLFCNRCIRGKATFWQNSTDWLAATLYHSQRTALKKDNHCLGPVSSPEKMVVKSRVMMGSDLPLIQHYIPQGHVYQPLLSLHKQGSCQAVTWIIKHKRRFVFKRFI